MTISNTDVKIYIDRNLIAAYVNASFILRLWGFDLGFYIMKTLLNIFSNFLK